MRSYIIIAVVMIACRPVGFLAMGVKKPAVENVVSIGNFLQQSSIQHGRHVISSFPGYLSNYMELGLTTIHVFSKSGKAVQLGPHQIKACGPDPVPFIRDLDKDKYALSSDSLVLDSITARLLLPDGAAFHYQRPDSVDFVAVITWAKWIGRKILNRDVVSCVQAVRENKQAVFDLIIVNLDKQAVWGSANLEKVISTRTGLYVLQ